MYHHLSLKGVLQHPNYYNESTRPFLLLAERSQHGFRSFFREFTVFLAEEGGVQAHCLITTY